MHPGLPVWVVLKEGREEGPGGKEETVVRAEIRDHPELPDRPGSAEEGHPGRGMEAAAGEELVGLAALVVGWWTRSSV